MLYKVIIINFPGDGNVFKQVGLDKVFELMNQFKNEHPGCHMFRPYCDDVIAGLHVLEKDNIICGLIVQEDEG